MRWGFCDVRVVVCKWEEAVCRFGETYLGKTHRARAAAGWGGMFPLLHPTYAAARFHGASTGALPPGCMAMGDRQGPLPRVPGAPAPLHWPLLPSERPA